MARTQAAQTMGQGLLAALILGLAAGTAAALEPAKLRCEYLENPVAVEAAQPRLSWIVVSDARGAKQTAYQVRVAASAEKLAEAGDLWDSGRVESDATTQIEYAGRVLTARQMCWWAVRVWDEKGQPSKWSQPARWTMGLLAKSDWQARWIADPVAATDEPRPDPRNGYHCEFAKSADTTKWVTIDLGKAERFDGIKLFPARPFDWHPDTPGFLFPLRFKLEAASNAEFSDAKILADKTAADVANPGTEPLTLSVAPTAARFVRLTVTRLHERDKGQFAFALAELQVLKGEAAVSKGAAVSALDSIEMPQWNKASLTDGQVKSSAPVGGSMVLPVTYARRSFQLAQPVKRATVYTTALGLYELHINGQRVGEQLLAPEWTNYRKHVQYQAYEVTALLREGENVLAALLGEGWYAGRLAFDGRCCYGTYPRFLLQLELELADGQKQVVVTDDKWQTTTDGPITASGIYDGEVYDARKEASGWDQPGFAAPTWRSAASFDLDARRLIGQRNEPIRVSQELTPVKVSEPKPGMFIFDLGQNMVGWCRLKAVGTAGQAVTLRHAEILNDDGTLFTANLTTALQRDIYTPRADGEFVFEPRFTYHGFRFVEVTGLAQRPEPQAITGRVFHSSSPLVGKFECSDASLNRLMENILWTQRANLMSVPTDCPQRAERMGWMGDIQAFSQTAIFNMDMAAFIAKFAQDVRDDQADDGRFPDFAPQPGDPNKAWSGVPAWGDAGTVVPWRSYQNYGDRRLMAEHFEAARRWVDYIHRHNPDLIWSKSRANDYNDWLNADTLEVAGLPKKGGAVPNEVFATAFFAYSTGIVADMAKVLGRQDDARRYGELREQIKAAFNQRFVKPDGRIAGDTQAGYALALSFNLLADDLRPKVLQYLTEGIRRYENHLSTGIQTSHRALIELSRGGQDDVAWQILMQRSMPSWLGMIDNGATTIWERWDGYIKGRGIHTSGMNSFNHWAFGAVGEWMWREIAGLNPDDASPGWKHFTVAPRPGGGVTWAKGEYQSIRGRIASEWKIEGGTITLRVVVPANTTATICVPTSDAAKVTEGGQAASPTRTTARRAEFEVGAGTYEYAAPYAPSAK